MLAEESISFKLAKVGHPWTTWNWKSKLLVVECYWFCSGIISRFTGLNNYQLPRSDNGREQSPPCIFSFQKRVWLAPKPHRMQHWEGLFSDTAKKFLMIYISMVVTHVKLNNSLICFCTIDHLEMNVGERESVLVRKMSVRHKIFKKWGTHNVAGKGN